MSITRGNILWKKKHAYKIRINLRKTTSSVLTCRFFTYYKRVNLKRHWLCSVKKWKHAQKGTSWVKVHWRANREICVKALLLSLYAEPKVTDAFTCCNSAGSQPHTTQRYQQSCAIAGNNSCVFLAESKLSPCPVWIFFPKTRQWSVKICHVWAQCASEKDCNEIPKVWWGERGPRLRVTSRLISHLKLMEDGVKMRIIDTPLPLTCLPIKLISFCQFIS